MTDYKAMNHETDNAHHSERGEMPPMDMAAMIDSGMRIVVGAVGIITLVVGVYYATFLFDAIYTALTAPQGFESAFLQWREILGGDALDITVDGQTVPLSRLAAIAFVGFGSMALFWLTLQIVYVGCKILTLMPRKDEPRRRR